jgi:hypothetical protein
MRTRAFFKKRMRRRTGIILKRQRLLHVVDDEIGRIRQHTVVFQCIKDHILRGWHFSEEKNLRQQKRLKRKEKKFNSEMGRRRSQSMNWNEKCPI